MKPNLFISLFQTPFSVIWPSCQQAIHDPAQLNTSIYSSKFGIKNTIL